MIRAIYQSYLSGVHRGRYKTPHNHWEMAMNNHQLVPKLLRCSKTSRCRQSKRVKRNPQPQRSPSATRCNHPSKCTRNHSQSHYDDESMMEMSGTCLLRLTRTLFLFLIPISPILTCIHVYIPSGVHLDQPQGSRVKLGLGPTHTSKTSQG